MNQMYDDWKAISTKIKSIRDVMATHSQLLLQVGTEHGEFSWICDSLDNTFDEIKIFKNNFIDVLSAKARECLEDFINKKENFFHNQDKRVGNTRARCAAMSIFEAEMSYIIHDVQVRIRKTVEIAFAHLQSLIVADESSRNTWSFKDQPDKGLIEVNFEKLGGAHLLHHKIWAFKTDSNGEKTDLVLAEYIDSGYNLYQSVDGLVLTEWKVFRKNDQLEKVILEGIAQASIYKRGSLAALELSNYCFIVIVSEKRLVIDNHTRHMNGVTYRVVNIAYNPDPPNIESKKITRISQI
jgi:hypothetical protein